MVAAEPNTQYLDTTLTSPFVAKVAPDILILFQILFLDLASAQRSLLWDFLRELTTLGSSPWSHETTSCARSNTQPDLQLFTSSMSRVHVCVWEASGYLQSARIHILVPLYAEFQQSRRAGCGKKTKENRGCRSIFLETRTPHFIRLKPYSVVSLRIHFKVINCFIS